ncbi:MAG: hypothetical protein BIFFINMI_02750 [Phycisphaerae bacterium]|nr:hypothetical protein [Phycisphaerae bacterium]
MRKTAAGLVAFMLASIVATPALRAADPDWVAPMRRVHAECKGDKGVLVHIGDSITDSMAYFAPLQYVNKSSLPADVAAALDAVNGRMKRECYRWKGPDKGNQGGQTAGWGLKNVDRWIAALKPEVAVVMFGSNDIRRESMAAYEKNLRALVQKCLDSGVVVILSTIPPMSGLDEKVRQAVAIDRRIAADLHVPLIDFYAHVLNRRPDDWNGTLPQFAAFSQWEVPTPISKDGVHPSNPKQWQADYTEAGLARNGNVLRTWLTLMAYAEVIHVALEGKAPSAISTQILGASPPAPKGAPLPGDASTSRPDADPAPAGPPMQAWFPKAPPLPKPAGQVINVRTPAELLEATKTVQPGGTILLADGVYRMPMALQIHTDRVAVRSAGGDRTKVVLDFAASRHTEGVSFTHCSDCTLADLTVQNIKQNGIKINSNLDVDRITIYNVISHNVWQRHVKGPAVPDKEGQADFAYGCRIQYCLFYNDRAKRLDDEPYEKENPGNFGGNYVGGIDAMNARDWVISDNVFTGIRGKTGSARGAIFLWHNATDCIVERNAVIDCDSGICLGNSSARDENRRHANGVIVRNNFVVRCPECSILAEHTRDCRVLNNSVFDPTSRLGRLVRVLNASDGLVVADNLFCGPRISIEKYEGKIDVRNNLVKQVSDYFVDPAHGNLHLKASAVDAIDKGTAGKDVPDDYDRQPRGDKPDLGADEFSAGEK